MKNFCYIPRQFLRHVADPAAHLRRLWSYHDGVQVHIVDDESVGGVSRSIKALRREGALHPESIVVSVVGFEKIMGAPFRLVDSDSHPEDRDAAIKWLRGHVRAAAQQTIRAFSHLGSSHVDALAKSLLTDPSSYKSSEDGLPAIKTHSQLQSLMVKYSFASRLRHLSRSLPPEVVHGALGDVERLTVACYESMLGDDLLFDKVLARHKLNPAEEEKSGFE